jgi:hypothetical protein
MSEVGDILTRIDEGDGLAAEELLPLVYGELRRMAAILLADEKPGHTLQPTALVHEAYLRLVGTGARSQETGARGQEPGVGEDGGRCEPTVNQQPVVPVSFSSRTHFFAAAAESMRRILVDRARARLTQKRGGGLARQELLDSDIAAQAPPAEVIGVHEALDALTAKDSLTAELIKLRYFGGFSLEEAGELLGMSRATAYRLWTYGRAWLRAELAHDGDSA